MVNTSQVKVSQNVHHSGVTLAAQPLVQHRQWCLFARMELGVCYSASQSQALFKVELGMVDGTVDADASSSAMC